MLSIGSYWHCLFCLDALSIHLGLKQQGSLDLGLSSSKTRDQKHSLSPPSPPCNNSSADLRPITRSSFILEKIKNYT